MGVLLCYYNSYGLVTYQTNAVDYLFGYDGYVWDQFDGLNVTGSREYNPV